MSAGVHLSAVEEDLQTLHTDSKIKRYKKRHVADSAYYNSAKHKPTQESCLSLKSLQLVFVLS